MKAKALCCANCEVRVANETELVEMDQGSGCQAQQFQRLFNLVVEDHKLQCLRYRHVHYEGANVATEFANRLLRTEFFERRALRMLLVVEGHVMFFRKSYYTREHGKAKMSQVSGQSD